jgi:curli biogenesis system outer membrane secretion channel CsgG
VANKSGALWRADRSSLNSVRWLTFSTRGALMGRHATPVSEKEKQRIIAALVSGVPVAHLHASGRFPDVSRKTMKAIANEAKVKRRLCRRKGTPLSMAKA